MKTKEEYWEQKAQIKMPDIEKYYNRNYAGISILKSFDELLPDLRNKSILDIGCGIGMYFPFFYQKGAVELVGVDVGENLLAMARKLCPYTKAVLSSADALPFSNECFDVIISMGLLEHFSDPQPVLKEWVRCLKRGGTLIIETPNMQNPIFARHYHRNKEQLVWQHEWDSDDLIKVIKMNSSLRFEKLASSIVFPYLASRFIDNRITRIFRLPFIVANVERVKFLKNLGHLMFVSAVKVSD